MDRNSPETEGMLTARPNGRKNTIQPFVNRHPLRKSSGNLEWKENSITSDTDIAVRSIPRPTLRQSDSLIAYPFGSPSPGPRTGRSTTSFGTPRHSGGTRIPRPKTTIPITDSQFQDIPSIQDHSPESPMRQPMSLNAAFKRAQEQTAAEVNSDSDNTIDLRQAFNMANAEFNGIQGIDGSPSPAPRSFRRGFYNTGPSKNGAGRKNNDLNKHLEQFDRNHRLASDIEPLNGLFSKNRVGSKLSEVGLALAHKASDSSLGGSPERQRQGAGTASPRKQENIRPDGTVAGDLPVVGSHSVEVDADVPVPSIEYEFASDGRSSPDFTPANVSPEKGMNWHLDADFTAGDLQFSASPRVTIGKPRSNSTNKSEDAGRALNIMSAYRRNNDRLTQIQKREVEAARTAFPEDTSAGKHMNPKLEEIRAREMEALSRRAVATSRLDEIRIRNSEPRSESPETRKDTDKGSPKEGSAGFKIDPRDVVKHTSDLEPRGEPIRDTPVVVFRNSSDRALGEGNQNRGKQDEDKREALYRSDSHDLLRRLARATSSSPGQQSAMTEQAKDASSPEKPVNEQLTETRSLNRSPIPQERRVRNLEFKNPKDRPTVGFADLIRIPSSDSIQERRTSKPTSEIDPTDRIEAELNLFAPVDNYSEKGSIRAPSPVPSEPIEEETPRPVKPDPLTQPTPRVTGAYVDTPATVRVKGEATDLDTTDLAAAAPEVVPAARNPNHSLSPAKHSKNPSITGRARSLKRSGPRSSSVPTASRRDRSSSRRRRPLVNTAKPPSVREDILGILRANDIDDSTLENLDSILADREVDDQDLKKMVNESILKVEDGLDMKFSDLTDRERELEVYDRMSKSLKTGLLGIRSAKKGIERLEDKVIHNDRKDEQPHPKAVPSTKPVPQSFQLPDEPPPILLSVPRLYHRYPKFRLTRFGIFAICAIIWYTLESTFCFLYAGPEYACTPSVPCDWSPNEPYFPYTMPFMLDEWATGGKGRALAWRVGEEVGDVLADVSDWVTNTDFTQSDQRYMDIWQRKRHKRRLRKHGLIPKWMPPPGYKAQYPAWQAETAAREVSQDLDLDEEDETMSADEIVR